LTPLDPPTTPTIHATPDPVPIFSLLWLLLRFLLLWSLRRLRFLLRQLLVLVLWLSWWWWGAARWLGRCWYAGASAGGHGLGWGYMCLPDHHAANVLITTL